MASKAPIATEHMEQVALFEWAGRMAKAQPALRLLFAIPNGAALVGKTMRTTAGKSVRVSIEAMKLRAEGLRPGVPDICLPVARGAFHGMYIEMKRRARGVISPEQLLWLEDLTAEGYCAMRCNGWDEARTAIASYLEGDDPR